MEETAEVQSRHKMIRALARELSADSKSKWQLAKDINLWVYLNLRKEMVDTVTALDALLERRGECQSHTFYSRLWRGLLEFPHALSMGWCTPKITRDFFIMPGPKFLLGNGEQWTPHLVKIEPMQPISN